MEIITRENYKLIEELNLLLKEAEIAKRFVVRIIDDGYDIGVVVGIPPLFNKIRDHYFLDIREDKKSEKTINKMISDINKDLHDLLSAIKPDIISLLKSKNDLEEKIEEDKKLIPNDYIEMYLTLNIKLC